MYGLRALGGPSLALSEAEEREFAALVKLRLSRPVVPLGAEPRANWREKAEAERMLAAAKARGEQPEDEQAWIDRAVAKMKQQAVEEKLAEELMTKEQKIQSRRRESARRLRRQRAGWRERELAEWTRRARRELAPVITLGKLVDNPLTPEEEQEFVDDIIAVYRHNKLMTRRGEKLMSWEQRKMTYKRQLIWSGWPEERAERECQRWERKMTPPPRSPRLATFLLQKD
jgi:hypothetical protein